MRLPPRTFSIAAWTSSLVNVGAQSENTFFPHLKSSMRASITCSAERNWSCNLLRSASAASRRLTMDLPALMLPPEAPLTLTCCLAKFSNAVFKTVGNAPAASNTRFAMPSFSSRNEIARCSASAVCCPKRGTTVCKRFSPETPLSTHFSGFSRAAPACATIVPVRCNLRGKRSLAATSCVDSVKVRGLEIPWPKPFCRLRKARC
mmetsp:Transcript_15159/g.26902  ORF Transcript_15159/g.26902 Transcript_15159/m.26902 type:complete len:205 (-) Transcript_15159:315-929(-)